MRILMSTLAASRCHSISSSLTHRRACLAAASFTIGRCSISGPNLAKPSKTLNLSHSQNLTSHASSISQRRCFCHGALDSSNARPQEGTDESRLNSESSSLQAQDLAAQEHDDASNNSPAREDEDASPPLLPLTSASKHTNSPKRRSAVFRNLSESRRGLFGRHNTQGTIPDLLTVPGIGPRNMEKLVAKGIEKVSELKQLYLDKFRGGGNDKMIEYLRSSVGILHKHHAISITAYIKDAVEKELKSDDHSNTETIGNKRLTFCVEGNISVGKTTFLHRITNEAIELRDLVEIVPEPVAKWQDIGPEHFNILDAFYAEPQRYAYTFQNYVFITRLMQEQESSVGLKPLRLMERSVFSDRMVFVRAVHEAKWMNEMEINIYDSWFNPVVSALPGLVPDAFIYLRASPDTCHKRLQMRKRPEEQGVSIDYLRDLHEKHEQWLIPAGSSQGKFSISQPSQIIEQLPPTLKDRVYYLEGQNVHSSIQKVPALILDCEPNIDFSRDLEAKAAYARQVGEFFEYVKKTKAIESNTDKKQDMSSERILFPRQSGLFMPSALHSQPLKSFDMRQHPSSLM